MVEHENNVKQDIMVGQFYFPINTVNKKIENLLLLSLFNYLPMIKAGPGFDECLTKWDTNGSRLYSDLLDYSFITNTEINNGKTMHLCCDDTISLGVCTPTTYAACDYTSIQCNKIAQTIFCADYDFDQCGGIVGKTLITTSTKIGSCSLDVSAMENFLRNDSLLKVDTLSKSGRYATWFCPASGNPNCAGLACGWDNGGWTCYNSSRALNVFDINIYNDVSAGCYLQWPASFPVVMANTPDPVFVTATTTVATTITLDSDTSTFSSLPADNSNLTIGLASATGVLGLYSLATMGLAGFWLWKRFIPSLG